MSLETDSSNGNAFSEKSNGIHFLKRIFLGNPKNLEDTSIFHHLSLIPFLAWVGLGADGLSSSSYGPEEAFKALGTHKYLAIPLVGLMALTVFIISAAYRKIVKEFPHGGGGYMVSSKLLGPKFGLVSGSALLVDYILTITISIAASGDAIFSFVPHHLHYWKMPLEIFFILGLTTLNIRGVKESVLVLTPVFIVFIITHFFAISYGIGSHLDILPKIVSEQTANFNQGYSSIGGWGLFLIFIHAYSLGGGTYTGIEAVSNGISIMRTPKVKTAKRTMSYMAFSLAFTASGILLCYLLLNTPIIPGKTMNASMLEQIAGKFSWGPVFIFTAILSEALLLVVAAQAGFIDGPRILANMAVDGWVPRRFGALSDRLTTSNGILLMCGAALLALFYTKGAVSLLVVMYSINVFLTFSLSLFGMTIHYFKKKNSINKFANLSLFITGFFLCITILTITIIEKFTHGGWITVLITTTLVLIFLAIKKHYNNVTDSLHRLYANIREPLPLEVRHCTLDKSKRTAAILVGSYGGLGVCTVKNILKNFPGVYQNFVFVSVGVIDSGKFKGISAVEKLKKDTEIRLQKYVKLATSLGVDASYRMKIDTDVVHGAPDLCVKLAGEFPQLTFFTGKIIFENEKWYQRILHNETGFALQKKMQKYGLTMVILPAKVSDENLNQPPHLFH
jgi:amino acid transporter